MIHPQSQYYVAHGSTRTTQWYRICQEVTGAAQLLPKKWKLKNMRNSYAVCASMKTVYYT